jgi:hypothetical protein
MSIEKRIRALEARMMTGSVILHFRDGSTQPMCGQGDFLVRLIEGVCRRAALSPGKAMQLDLIRQSVYAQEPGGGRMLELLRCLLDAREQSSLAPAGS